ncbi:hypothetical protein J6590_098589 [Homalodisca vitripennis]|nr:hypothetical protein J6590_098589 [Homalodisca vitripennis]
MITNLQHRGKIYDSFNRSQSSERSNQWVSAVWRENLFFVFPPRVFVIKIYAELTAWCIEVSPIGMNPFIECRCFENCSHLRRRLVATRGNRANSKSPCGKKLQHGKLYIAWWQQVKLYVAWWQQVATRQTLHRLVATSSNKANSTSPGGNK